MKRIRRHFQTFFRRQIASGSKTLSVFRTVYELLSVSKTRIAFSFALLLFVACFQPSAICAQNDAVSFNRDIRPILSDKCFHCHGPDEESREAYLRFDLEDSAKQVIEPGNIDDSELISRILSDDDETLMPPPHANKPLEESEIELLKTWVKQGAKFSKFWAYVPPEKHPIPEAGQKFENWIDQMVVARLRSNEIEPAPMADKTTLIRRLYFDLIGLPPTPTQVESFLADDSGDAVEKVVDELLASKHFGERLAIYWLDLVRFADTVGYHGDQDHNISPYRDWVINAFNDNMPFDQFTREQLAGDLLPDPTEQQKIATGYNRLLQTTHEGGLQPKEYSAIYAADRVRNVSLVWMGATVGCAQCHDHKYDPYTAEDFYSLAAFFADIDDEKHFKSGTNALPTQRPPEILIISDENREELDVATAKVKTAEEMVKKTKSEIEKLKKQLTAISKEAIEGTEKEPVGESEIEPSPEDEKREAEMAAQIDAIQEEIAKLEKQIGPLQKKHNQLKNRRSEIESRGAWTMITQALKEPRTLRVLPRGNFLDESGPIVDPAVPTFMGTIDSTNERATRMDLANWLTDGSSESGKLTARVFANRFWYQFMGVGISKSLDDFGGQGEPPAFPELLDNLALEFVENQWDVKKLIRRIVTSRTYQQASLDSKSLKNVDPYNQLFARQSRFRLPAELIRDNVLAISGLLKTDEVGGKSIKPAQPAGYYQHLNFPTRKYKQHTDDRQWRRGVYVHWQRQFLHPTLKAFDAPSREECTAERPKSNTPSAALALLNDPVFIDAARAFAKRVFEESNSEKFEDRLELAFGYAVSRKPERAEIDLLKRLYDSSVEEIKSSGSAKSVLGIEKETKEEVKIVNGSDDRLIDQAAWTTLARAILNMNETITRN